MLESAHIRRGSLMNVAPQEDQESLAAQLRLYETVLRATPDLTYVFDLQHRFIYANQALLAMWGMTWEQAAFKTCLELGYEPWHAAMHDEEIERVIATRQPVRGEVPFPHVTEGVRIYDYIFSPVFGPEGEVEAIAGSTRDITLRKQHEQHMQLLINELNHRVKNTLATVQSLALQTLRGSTDMADAQDKMESRLVALSDYLDTYANTGSVNTVCYGAPGTNGCQVTFNATASGLNVFDIDTSILSDTNTITINLGANSKILVNVSGTSVRLDGGMSLVGGNASQVLFNFSQATDFVVGNMGFLGSALAPTAVYSGGGGVINGQLIVDSFTGDTWGGIGGTQVNKVKFSGDLLSISPTPVPEPATWALMIGGFGLAGAMLRRRRALAAA